MRERLLDFLLHPILLLCLNFLPISYGNFSPSSFTNRHSSKLLRFFFELQGHFLPSTPFTVTISTLLRLILEDTRTFRIKKRYPCLLSLHGLSRNRTALGFYNMNVSCSGFKRMIMNDGLLSNSWISTGYSTQVYTTWLTLKNLLIFPTMFSYLFIYFLCFPSRCANESNNTLIFRLPQLYLF